MKWFLLFIFSWCLAACASAPFGPAASPTVAGGQMYTPVPGFGVTKMYQITAEAETMTAGLPKNDATITAIMSSKYAGGTAAAETMTAKPTPSLTPTIPPDSPLCRAGDLQADYRGAMGATQSLLIWVGLTDVGAQPCFLHVRPQAVFVDRSGKLLDIQYSFSPNWDTPADPEAMLSLPSGRMAAFSLWWGNWCLPAEEGGIFIRLDLARNGETITIPTDLSGGPVCNDPGSKSWIAISPVDLP